MDHIPWRRAIDPTTIVLRLAFWLCLMVLPPWMGVAQTTVEGHVLQASSSSKLPGVLVNSPVSSWYVRPRYEKVR